MPKTVKRIPKMEGRMAPKTEPRSQAWVEFGEAVRQMTGGIATLDARLGYLERLQIQTAAQDRLCPAADRPTASLGVQSMGNAQKTPETATIRDVISCIHTELTQLEDALNPVSSLATPAENVPQQPNAGTVLEIIVADLQRLRARVEAIRPRLVL